MGAPSGRCGACVSIAFRLLPPVGHTASLLAEGVEPPEESQSPFGCFHRWDSDGRTREQAAHMTARVSIAFRLLPPVGPKIGGKNKQGKTSCLESQSPFGCFHRWDGGDAVSVQAWAYPAYDVSIAFRLLPPVGLRQFGMGLLPHLHSRLNRLSAASTGGTILGGKREKVARLDNGVSIAFRLLPPVGRGEMTAEEQAIADVNVSIAFRLLPPVGRVERLRKALERVSLNRLSAASTGGTGSPAAVGMGQAGAVLSQSPFGCFHRWDRN